MVFPVVLFEDLDAMMEREFVRKAEESSRVTLALLESRSEIIQICQKIREVVQAKVVGQVTFHFRPEVFQTARFVFDICFEHDEDLRAASREVSAVEGVRNNLIYKELVVVEIRFSVRVPN